jgi:hypothetical protein
MAQEAIAESKEAQRFLLNNTMSTPDLTTYGEAIEQCSTNLEKFGQAYFDEDQSGLDETLPGLANCETPLAQAAQAMRSQTRPH